MWAWIMQLMEWTGQFWCQGTHTQATWPMHGKYICTQCFREYRLNWEGPARRTEYADPSLYNAGVPIAPNVPLSTMS